MAADALETNCPSLLAPADLEFVCSGPYYALDVQVTIFQAFLSGLGN